MIRPSNYKYIYIFIIITSPRLSYQYIIDVDIQCQDMRGLCDEELIQGMVLVIGGLFDFGECLEYQSL